MIELALEQDIGRGQVQVWTIATEWTLIGRSAEAHILVSSPAVRKEHARVRQGDGVLELILLVEHHETQVNGEPIRPHERVRLPLGALLTLGSGVRFSVVSRGEMASVFDQGPIPPPPPVVPPGPPPEPPLGPPPEAPPENEGAHLGAPPEPPPDDEPPAEPAAPPDVPTDRRSRYMRYLPDPFHQLDQDGRPPFLDRFLLIFEDTWEPLEERQDHLSHYLHAATAHARMVPWLLRWFGLDLGAGWPVDRQRAVLANAGELLGALGTRAGLTDLLALLAQREVQIAEPEPWTLEVWVQGPADPALERRLHALVNRFKPAHACWTLAWGPS